MSKVSFIIRAQNRLEYTSLTIREIDKKAGFNDYNIIVIDQASSDGTTQWLKSLEIEKYYKLKVQYNTINTGDAGGMHDGFKLIDNDCQYVLQWDNDCAPITENFLNDAVDIMDSHKNIGILMFKRTGVGTALRTSNQFNHKKNRIGDVQHATCCMIIRKELLEQVDYWKKEQNIGWGFDISAKIKKLGYRICKCETLLVNHIDGGDADNKQVKKFPNYMKSAANFYNRQRPTNYKEFNYDNSNT